ncbi:MAG TPA: hypothetical protein VKY85_20085 [Candidatus Angelobacter sp.]|nr:hypothetical protein [Candidatus Angelobacter sp.]
MAFDKTPFEDLGRKLNNEIGEATQKLEQEGEKLITYLNDEVVPAIRGNSSKALRVAAEKLSQLANYMEHKTSK